MPLKPLPRPLAEPGGRNRSTCTILVWSRRASDAGDRTSSKLPSSALPPSPVVQTVSCGDTRGKSARFRGGDLTQRLNPDPPDYGAAFASSLLLSPQPRRRTSRLAFPESGGLRAYRVPRMIIDGLGSACSPVARQRRQGKGKPLHLATYLLVQACQRLWLVSSHGVYRQFTWVSPAIHPGPRPPWR